MIIRVDDQGLTVTTRRQALERVRRSLREYIPEGSDLSGELIEDRRREVERDAKE